MTTKPNGRLVPARGGIWAGVPMNMVRFTTIIANLPKLDGRKLKAETLLNLPRLPDNLPRLPDNH